jgi:hypothetical protein
MKELARAAVNTVIKRYKNPAYRAGRIQIGGKLIIKSRFFPSNPDGILREPYTAARIIYTSAISSAAARAASLYLSGVMPYASRIF